MDLYQCVKDQLSDEHKVAEQTEASKTPNSIWNYIITGNLKEVVKLSKDRKVMRDRGPVGELPIHLCFLYNGPTQIKMAWHMIEEDPTLLTEEYTGDDYGGENVLHIAIINRRLDLVMELVQKEPKLLHSKAIGKFFEVGKACYYGETPLAFALCTNQLDMFDVLVQAGADMNVVDRYGNNILHVLVLRNLQEAYEHFIDRWNSKYQSELKKTNLVEQKETNLVKQKMKKSKQKDKKKKNSETNAISIHSSIPGQSQGEEPKVLEENLKMKDSKHVEIIEPWKKENNKEYTPFVLCAAEGTSEMFDFLLEKTKQIQWAYGPVTCMLYPLDEFNTALKAIIDCSRSNLLDNARVKALIDTKWKHFGKRKLWRRFFICIFYFLIFTYFAIMRQRIYGQIPVNNCEVVNEVIPLQAPVTVVPLDHVTFYSLFTLVFAGAFLKGKTEIEEMREKGWQTYFGCSGAGLMENLISSTYCVLIMIFTLVHFMKLPFERMFLAMAAFTGITYFFIFLLALRMTGPMVIMVWEMLNNDIMRFCSVYAVFIISFGLTFFILSDSQGLEGIFEKFNMCFEATLGDFDFGVHDKQEDYYRSLSSFLLLGYIVIVSICLLNLLIAMMGETYSKVNEEAEHKWQLERARIIMAIENEMSPVEKNSKSNKYFIELDNDRFLQIQSEDLKPPPLSKTTKTNEISESTEKDDQSE